MTNFVRATWACTIRMWHVFKPILRCRRAFFDNLTGCPVLFFLSQFCFFFSLWIVFVSVSLNVSFVDVLHTAFFLSVFSAAAVVMLLAFLSTKFHLCQFCDCQNQSWNQYVMCLFVNHSWNTFFESFFHRL